MKFPWHKYCSIKVDRRPTMQIYITNKCNLRCPGCFARFAADKDAEGDSCMRMTEYDVAVAEARSKGAKQINILGGEPLLHSKIDTMCSHNFDRGLKTTIYTNGLLLDKFVPQHFHGAKLRVSVDGMITGSKPFCRVEHSIEQYKGEVDINYMVSGETIMADLRLAARQAEDLGCKTFFISSYRYLDNNRDFFEDDSGSFSVIDGVIYNPPKAMPLIRYKELVHAFLYDYAGNMDIHISKRGMFEDLNGQPMCQCNFVNYFIGGKIIQCPYDVVNLKYQTDYQFGQRYCQHNSTCLMSKIIVRPCTRGHS